MAAPEVTSQPASFIGRAIVGSIAAARGLVDFVVAFTVAVVKPIVAFLTASHGGLNTDRALLVAITVIVAVFVASALHRRSHAAYRVEEVKGKAAAKGRTKAAKAEAKAAAAGRSRRASEEAEDSPAEAEPEEQVTKTQAPRDGLSKSQIKALARAEANKPKSKPPTEGEIPELAGVVKGFSDDVTAVCVTGDGRIVAAAAKDGTVRMMSVQAVIAAGGQAKFAQSRIEYDHATAMCVSNSGHLLAVGTADQLAVHVFVANHKDATLVLKKTFRTGHEGTISQMKMAAFPALPASAFIVTVATDDVNVKFWSQTGDHLTTITTHQVKHHGLALAPNAKFVTVPNWTAELKLWHPTHTNTGSFHTVTKAMSCTIGKSTVSADFSANGDVMVAAAANNTWSVWNVGVRYEVREDPACLHTQPSDEPLKFVAVSPNAKVVAVATARTLQYFSLKGKAVSRVISLPASTGDFLSLEFSGSGHELVSGHAAGKFALMWKTPPVAHDGSDHK